MLRELAFLGGEKVRTAPFAQRRTMGDAEKSAVMQVMDSDSLSSFIGGKGPMFNGGHFVRAFEEKCCSAFDAKHAVSVNSWTSGLVAAIGAVGVEPGDEVICSPFTMSASATCALFYGGIPVFADIDSVTYCLSPESIERCITPRTKAIVVVHLFGHAADMDAILEIARPRGIFVIEDAAQAPGVTYKGRKIGSIGDIGGFSLNYHKHIHTGEGGVIVTNSDVLAQRCRLIRNHGENANAELEGVAIANTIGGNYRLTELQAAIGSAQLERLDGYLQIRRELANYVSQQLKDVLGLAVQPAQASHAHYCYPIRFDANQIGISRSLFTKAVNAELPTPNGVESTPLAAGYVKPLYHSSIYQRQIAIGTKGFPFNFNQNVKYDYSPGICPVAEQAYSHGLLLSTLVREPLTTTDMKDFVNAIKKVVSHVHELKETYGDRALYEGEVVTPVDIASGLETNS
jgi:perosamine synthetase